MKLPNFVEKVFQKLDMILLIQKWKLSNKSFHKKCAPKLVFFIKKTQKDSNNS